MSHGGGGEGKSDPNLTPLLDVVLQLLMFFMMCVNFVTEQVNQNVMLPVAESARPMDKTLSEVLFLNLNSRGLLEVPGRDPMSTVSQWNAYLKQQYEDAQRTSKFKGGSGQVQTTVIIRADRSVQYKMVYDLLQKCKTVGYRRLQMRATTRAGG